MNEDQAKLNITWNGSNGDLPDPIYFDASDSDIKRWAKEAISSGSIPGIPMESEVDFTDFKVDRFTANDNRGNLVQLRPKTPFGAQ